MQSHWEGFQKALATNSIPATTKEPVAIYPTSDSRIGVSGFLDLKPKDPKTQSKYDAMSWEWKGVQASEKASVRGSDFSQ
jgi:hypothetical protein